TSPAASASLAARILLVTQPPLIAVMQGGEYAVQLKDAHRAPSQFGAPTRETIAERTKNNRALDGTCRLVSETLWTAIAPMPPPAANDRPANSGSREWIPRRTAETITMMNQSARTPPKAPQSATTCR